MKHLRKYETFDFDQTIPITTKNFLTNFYSCDDCDAVWKEFNNTADKCKFCDSNEIEELEEDEWYEVSKGRMDVEGGKKLDDERKEESDSVIDLMKSKKDDTSGNLNFFY